MKIATWRDHPPALKSHMDQRLRERKISVEDLTKVQFWLRTNPDVPASEWFKDFGSFKLCGEGRYVKTFLEADMAGYGQEL